MGPAIFGVSVSQINLMLDTMLATFSAHRQCLLAVLLRPTLGAASGGVCGGHCHGDTAESIAPSRGQFRGGLFPDSRLGPAHGAVLIAVPAAAALMLLAEPILATLFLYGEVMTPRDMSMASLSLRAYSLGLDRLYANQGVGAGLFCPSGYAHAGAYRRDCHGLQYAA